MNDKSYKFLVLKNFVKGFRERAQKQHCLTEDWAKRIEQKIVSCHSSIVIDNGSNFLFIFQYCLVRSFQLSTNPCWVCLSRNRAFVVTSFYLETDR